jgi:putative hemolysin
MTNIESIKQQSSLEGQIPAFHPRIKLELEEDGFVVKTASSPAELKQVLALRHDIFIREWQGRETENGLDLEHFDFSGDHLMIIRKSDNLVVGTYRLLCSRFVERFYSQDEFQLDEFLSRPAEKLELGRACVHPEFRNGITIDLLWKGLAKYITASGSRYLFGCTSVKSVDPRFIEQIYIELKGRDQWSQDYGILSTAKYRFDGFSFTGGTPTENSHQLRQMLPSLLRSYLHAGASVYGEPALDRDFECVDLLTILDLEHLSRRFRERFFSNG